jgi:uncharacterized protein (TIGR03083 family)
MTGSADAYARVQTRFGELLLGLSPADLERTVPNCPEWTIHDVARHVNAGLVESATGGSPEFAGGLDLQEHWRDPTVKTALDTMLRRQLAERRERSVVDLVEEWGAAVDRHRALLDGTEPWPAPWNEFMPYILLSDIVVHEADVRDALGLAPLPPSEELSLALAGYVMALDTRLRALGRPALALDTAGQRMIAGAGSPVAALNADTYELLMVLTGRRRIDRITELDWTGSPEPFLDVLSAYEQPQ